MYNYVGIKRIILFTTNETVAESTLGGLGESAVLAV